MIVRYSPGWPSWFTDLLSVSLLVATTFVLRMYLGEYFKLLLKIMMRISRIRTHPGSSCNGRISMTVIFFISLSRRPSIFRAAENLGARGDWHFLPSTLRINLSRLQVSNNANIQCLYRLHAIRTSRTRFLQRSRGKLQEQALSEAVENCSKQWSLSWHAARLC